MSPRLILPLLCLATLASAQTSPSPSPSPGAADPAAEVPAVAEPAIYLDPTQPMPQRVDDLLKRMSLAEKVAQLQNIAPAIPRLQVPAYNYWSEALHGVAFNGVATVFPQAIGMAATWDADLLHAEGQLIAIEGRAKYNAASVEQRRKTGVGLTFWSPNINIFRDPRWGRGQETYGEDPVLSGHLGVAFITGIQGNDPAHAPALACAKHYAVHSGPEPLRHAFDVAPSTRDLYETYLPQFEEAVRVAHVGQVMSAYNSLYGVPAPASEFLLTDILRTRWGFDGYVVSDCDAVGDITKKHHYVATMPEAAAAAVKAGTDLNCGRAYAALTVAVAQKLVSEAEVDTALRRVLAARFRLGSFDPSTPWDHLGLSDVATPASVALSLKAARESIVLLKNSGVLPIDRGKVKRIAVIGSSADDAVMLLGNYHGETTHPVTILSGLRAAAGPDLAIDYEAGAPLVLKRGETFTSESPAWQRAVTLVRGADVVVYVGGINSLLEGEEMRNPYEGFAGGDRTRIELPEVQEQFVRALAAESKPVVMVNCSGSAMALAWEAEHLPAIVQAWYPGEQGGTAVADVLFGKVSPSGRLPITFYASTSDLPEFTDYRMANRTYRYFAGKPLYAFGQGLSYTKFEYGKPQLGDAPLTAAGSIHLRVPIHNAGAMDGEEVVQVYARNLKSASPQPIHSLAAFKRVAVARGETVEADLTFPVRQLRYWDETRKDYWVEPGAYEVQIASASNDARQKQEITVAP